MNPRVVSVRHHHASLLTVEFSNGERRRFDLGPYLQYEVFERLRDPGFVALVREDHGTLSWPGGIDLDPDSVYLESVPIEHPAET